MNNDRPIVTTDHIRSYLKCPRQYEYKHKLTIDTDDYEDHRSKREVLLRKIIARVFDEYQEDIPDQRLVVKFALNLLDEMWNNFAGDNQPILLSQYDKAVAEEALRVYFQGPGYEHLSKIYMNDKGLIYNMSQTYPLLVCPMVTVLTNESEGSVQIIKYVTTLSSVGVGWIPDYIEWMSEYNKQEEFRPRKVAAIIEAAVAIEAAKDRYSSQKDEPDRYEFAYFALENDVSLKGEIGTDDRPVKVRQEQQKLSNHYEQEQKMTKSIIKQNAQAILEKEHAPDGSRWNDILDSSCDYCKYQHMCEDYLGQEVKF